MKNTLNLIFERNFDIGNIHAHSIPQQLRHRLRTVNCSGNRQHPCNWCCSTALRVPNIPTNYESLVIQRTHI